MDGGRGKRTDGKWIQAGRMNNILVKPLVINKFLHNTGSAIVIAIKIS
jgi:hypothetical protein